METRQGLKHDLLKILASKVMHSVDRPYDKGRGRGGQPPHEDGVEQGHAGPRLLLEVRLEGEERPPAQHLVQYSTVQYSTVQYRPPRHPRNSGQGVPLRRLLGRPRPHPQNPVGDDIRCYKRILLQPSTRHVKRWFAKFDTILLLCIGPV